MKNQKKKTIIKKILSTFIFFALIFLLPVTTSLIKDKAMLNDTVLNMQKKEIDADGLTVYGKAQFYFDQLLISENNKDLISDGKISLGNSFSGKTIVRDNKEIKLTNKGKCTYRFTLLGLKDQHLSYKRDDKNKIKVYINSSLIYSNIADDLVNKRYEIQSDRKAEITIECLNSNSGGLLQAPTFIGDKYTTRSDNIYMAVIFLCIGINIAAFLISLAFYLFTTKKRIRLPLFIQVVFLLASLVSSVDMNFILTYSAVSSNIFAIYLSNAIISLLNLYMLFECISTDIKGKNKTIARSIAIYLVLSSLIASIFTYRSEIFYLPLLILIPLLIYAYIMILKDKKPFYNMLIASIFSILSFHLLTIDGIYQFNTTSIYTTSITALIVALVIYILYSFSKTAKDLKKEKDMELSLMKSRSDALQEQMKPHYLFNTLNALKSSYHRDIKSGDKLLSLLSDNQRKSSKALSNSLIEFKEEIEIVESYIELENNRKKKSFDVIYDFQVEDFKIPPLVIECLIENCLKHSMIEEKEDGMIEISTYEDGSNIVIEVKDNGIGFDIDTVESSSVGIKNARKRLESELEATLTITSKLDKGTTCTIKIPKKERKDDQE